MRVPAVRRVQVAWAGCATAEVAQEVALSVHAFSVGGVGAVGLMGLVRSVPAAGLGPLATGVADRYPRQRVLQTVLVCRTALLAGLAWAVAADAPLAVVYVLAAVDATVFTLYWPAQSALLPDLVGTPEELTASNATATLIENVGALVGPGLAGVVLALSGRALVFAIGAVLTGAAALAATRIAVGRPPRPTPAEATGQALLGGFRALLGDRAPRLVFVLYLVHTLCVGALSVLVVVVGLELLDIGEAGVGFLGVAVGVGGVAGSMAAFGLVGYRRLTRPLRLAMLVWGVALAAVAVVLRVPVAVAALVVMGGCTAVVDVCAVNGLQRIVRERLLGRVLGVVEGAWWAMVGLGSIGAAVLADAVGGRTALVVTGGTLAGATVLAARALAVVDARARPPEAELAALRSVPMFRGQPPLPLERLALELERVTFAPGEAVVVMGEAGDRFYMIEEGTVHVTAPGVDVRLGPGEWFGEIALLRDVPRTATVRAVSDVRLFALERDDFLAAVSAPRSDTPRPGDAPCKDLGGAGR